MIKLYNSLTNKIEEFIPQDKNQVSIYFCGPTVYDYPHLGNARAAIFSDLINRTFIANGYKVKYVSNFTDVDDKIVKNALEKNINIREYSNFFKEVYLEDMKSLNVLDIIRPSVLDYINDIINLIEKLIEINYAYQINGNVYFRIKKLKEYMVLSKHNLDDLNAGSRIDVNDEKEDPLDFVLWKKTNIGENFDSPFSKGRPGWHSECLVMIKNIFGENLIDIHGGGGDLRFPHHENEIAQSMALYNNKIAKYWLHNSMLKINNSKMSKSQGNIISIRDAVKKYGSNLIRYFLISAPYNKTLNFSEEILDNLNIELNKIIDCYNKLNVYIQLNNLKSNNNKLDYFDKFIENLNNNFNMQNAMSVVFQLIKDINIKIRKKENNLYDYLLEFNKINSVLGIKFEDIILSEEDIKKYYQWDELKKDKKFEEADKIRNYLMEKNII